MLRYKFSWIHAIVFAVSIILIGLIAIRLVNFYSEPKTSRLSELLEVRPLDIVFGSDTANITVFIYSSYSCSYCNLFFTEAFPLLKEEFIDSGKVKLIMRLTVKTNNVDLLNSLKTAVCINKYGNFEYLHQLLLNNNKVVYTTEFRNIIDEFIDKDIIVAECILGNEAEEYLLQNINDFEAFGMKGTPTFIIGNKIYAGYKDYQTFNENLLEHLTN
ncbi:MAG: hypothetical protein CVT98_10595 [Bacteroidetes bacterium HGW-Bacteroidetes-15]|nr:MAG: hypothetical protein CVT98_10595 [Bacteroidetes bacterium HGW-Bacteroidetes-15]